LPTPLKRLKAHQRTPKLSRFESGTDVKVKAPALIDFML
jgi:hypothetical protein